MLVENTKNTAERLRHESDSQHGGLAHWRQNTNRQRDYDDQVLHGGMGMPLVKTSPAQAAAIACGTSTRSPGMGLEAENLQSFISGSYQAVAPSRSASPAKPLKVEAESDIGNYRRKKSITFTNLLVRASSLLKA